MSRKNISQTLEAGLTMIADELYRRIEQKKLLSKPKDLRKLLEEFRLNHYLKMSDAELVADISSKKRLQYITGCYGTITPADAANMMEKLDLEEGRFTILKSDGRPLRGKVVCGYQYMVKLMFLASYSNKVTGDDDDIDSMVLGLGGEKMEGQSLEEMIFWALQSHGATKAIDEFRDKSGRTSEYWLRAHILTAGLDLAKVDLNDLNKKK